MTNAIQIMSWNEAAAFYERLDSARGNTPSSMAELARFIASSRYANGMFFAISDETLHIGRTANFTAGKDELRISFDKAEQTFTFTHTKSPDEKYPWSLSCPATEWNSTFERIVHKRLRWFHEG